MNAALSVILGIIIAIVGLFIIYLLVLNISAFLVNPHKIYEDDSKYYRFLFNLSTFFTIKIMRIRLHVSGLEKVPKEGRFVLVGNHVSNYDPILTEYVLKDRQLAFISKEANMHIPAFGRIIRRMCFLSIDREHPSIAAQTIYKAADMIKQDKVSFAVYPEGTRSKSGELLSFHNAVFKVPKTADVPIIVMSIKGTNSIFKDFIWKRTDVYLDFLEVLDKEYVQANRTHAIGERVEKILREKLEQEYKEETIDG